MSTVVEIEQAIEMMTHEQWLKLRAWFVECHTTIAASSNVFVLYDAAGGAELQWQD